MKKSCYQVQIFVQDANEYAQAFTERLNEWLQNHKYEPILVSATCSTDGRQTLNFQWYEVYTK